MTRIFLLHATGTEDFACASRIRQDLNIRGYTVYDEVQTFDIHEMISQNSALCELVGSAAVLLLWSSNATQNERIWNAIRFTQQLKRPVLVITLDSSPLPDMLKGAAATLASPPYDTVVAALSSSLPAPQSNEPLHALYEQAIEISPPQRKQAIEDAGKLLQNGQSVDRDAVIALLECLAQRDPITSVKEKAQEQLNLLQTRAVPHSVPSPVPQSRDPFFEVACPYCGQVSRFDKREECKKKTLYRGRQHVLTCKTCGKEFGFDLDCGGYV